MTSGEFTIDAETLLRLGTATIYEASKSDCFLPSRIKPSWPGARLAGRAFPVGTAPADNLPLHLALERVERGDVLVVDGKAEDCGYWGDVLSVAARARGVLGLVIDGGVRDAARLEEQGFPVFSSAISIRGTAKSDHGTIGEPIVLGSATIERGDVVVADRDGVVVVPRARYAEVLEAAQARELAESDYMERLRTGELTIDVLGLRNR